MHARVTRYQGPSDADLDANVGEKRGVLPTAFGQTEGMKGVIFMIDKENGVIVVTSLWESEEALKASEDEATRVREQVKRPDETTTVERYEVTYLSVEQA